MKLEKCIKYIFIKYIFQIYFYYIYQIYFYYIYIKYILYLLSTYFSNQPFFNRLRKWAETEPIYLCKY